MALTEMGAKELAELIAQGGVSAEEAVMATLERIQQTEPYLHALLTVCPEQAISHARELDRSRTSETRGPLAGVPVIVKDNICTAGIETTCASRMLADWVPPYSATVVERLQQAGGIVVAKSNLDEFAMGSSTENSAFGPSRNPWNVACVPGGSSGGSASSVAARQAPLALGSDTGGSIRQPAALCGIVGLKPTYGRVSRYGLVAYASSLDQIGPMARSVRDVALLFQVIAGGDRKDSTCVSMPPSDYEAACMADVRGLRIGVPREYFASGVQAEVASAVRTAVDTLSDLGAIAEECSMPSTSWSLAAYYVIAPAEASSNLARYDGVKYGFRANAAGRGHTGMAERTRAEGFGREVKQRIMVGTYALSAGYYEAYYKRAQQVRTLIRRDFERAFERYDVLITPTSPTVAFRLGERAEDPLAMKLADTCTLPANMAGVPAISVPCGFHDGLPIGLQIMAKPFDEVTLLRAAYTYEQATDWWRRSPEL